jgi:hypothetical protein
MALHLVQVDTRAGVLLQDPRGNRCHHHNGVPTMVGLLNNRDMVLMVRHVIQFKFFINELIYYIQQYLSSSQY